ncbi:unnamed protein product (macronuclear) [Paramecium tetraurelia]|uniref:Uncharacterized protein n=1 Tax=Paramecium tetraurelia TaxID=5888 RepID=A0DC80_PARTE|nr:uncharacterized protein GSPATT00015525001 [Paramecium tetraurelia]CAK80647.1 unnamed protein product [Paramecium tetraurelia]|eukprot:XP_001448044.1 hypothetical protein (macronuclear) [Paramecium tetraurelia strain d4-2]
MNYNYKYLVQSPKKQLQPKVTIKYSTAINLDHIPKFSYGSPRSLARQITNLSPTVQLNSSRNKKTVESKSPSPLIESNWLNINKIKKKIELFENLNYGHPKIFHKLSPDQMIPTQLSIPITAHAKKRIMIKKKCEPDRIARSNTQHSMGRQEMKNNTSPSRVLQKRKNKKDPSGELNGWQGQYVEHFDDFI